MRWTSRCSRVALRMDSTTGGPIVRLSTKWPSITSRWSMEAPPRVTRVMSSARRAKSADKIDGTISIICWLIRFYHSGEEPVPGIAAGEPAHDLNHEGGRDGGGHSLVLFRLERAGGVDQQTAGRKRGAGVGQQGGLAPLEILKIGTGEPPFDFGIAAQRAGAGAGSVDQYAVEWALERERACTVEHHKVGGERLELGDAVEVQIAGDGVDAGLQGLSGLVAGSGARIEEALA